MSVRMQYNGVNHLLGLFRGLAENAIHGSTVCPDDRAEAPADVDFFLGQLAVVVEFRTCRVGPVLWRG
jgi:hypothetical protein